MYLIDKCTVVFSIKICTNKLISANCPYLSLLEAKKKSYETCGLLYFSTTTTTK